MTKQCPNCKKEVPIGAKTCEFCNADLRDWIYKHKFLTGIGIFLGLFLLLLFSSDNTNSSKSSEKEATSNVQTSESSKNSEKSVDDQKKEENKLPKVNEEATVDTLKITVKKVDNLGQRITRPYISPIVTQGKFIRIDFEVENTGNQAEYMGTLEVIDEKGRTFSESDQKYSILSNEANFLDKFNPNVKTKYSTIFDIAGDAKKLKLKVSGFGLFNTNTTMIDLGIDA